MDIRILWFFPRKNHWHFTDLWFFFSKILPFLSSDKKTYFTPQNLVWAIRPLCQIIVFNAEPIRPQPWRKKIILWLDPKVCADPSWLLVFKKRRTKLGYFSWIMVTCPILNISCTSTHGNLLLYLVCPVSLIMVTCPILSMSCISKHGYLPYTQKYVLYSWWPVLYLACPLFLHNRQNLFGSFVPATPPTLPILIGKIGFPEFAN